MKPLKIVGLTILFIGISTRLLAADATKANIDLFTSLLPLFSAMAAVIFFVLNRIDAKSKEDRKYIDGEINEIKEYVKNINNTLEKFQKDSETRAGRSRKNLTLISACNTKYLRIMKDLDLRLNNLELDIIDIFNKSNMKRRMRTQKPNPELYDVGENIDPFESLNDSFDATIDNPPS